MRQDLMLIIFRYQYDWELNSSYVYVIPVEFMEWDDYFFYCF